MRYTKLLLALATLPFVRAAIVERADLSAFRVRPTARIVSGVSLIAVSFLLGWPAVSLFGFLAMKFHNPWWLVVGGPLVYGFSHLVFLAGMYLSGAEYSLIFCRWLTRISVERLLAWKGMDAATVAADAKR